MVPCVRPLTRADQRQKHCAEQASCSPCMLRKELLGACASGQVAYGQVLLTVRPSQALTLDTNMPKQVEGASYGQLAGQRRKVQLMKAYRFVLGAENTVQVDYITEKFWQLFGSGWAAALPPPRPGREMAPSYSTCMSLVICMCKPDEPLPVHAVSLPDFRPYHPVADGTRVGLVGRCAPAGTHASRCSMRCLCLHAKCTMALCVPEDCSAVHTPLLLAAAQLLEPGGICLCRRLPLYLGAPNAAAFAPPGSFISVLEHSPRQLARLLRHLSADEEAYAAYFEWRGGESQGGWVRHFNKAMHEHVAFGPRGDGLDWVCKLCKVQHKYYDWPEDTSTE